MHFVRPNPANPYFPELSGLLLKALGPRPVLAEQLEGLEGIDECLPLRLLGPAVRG